MRFEACYPSTIESLRSSLLCEASLGTRRSRHTPKSHSPTRNLERAGLQIAAAAQPSKAYRLFQHLKAPTWVTSRRNPARRADSLSQDDVGLVKGKTDCISAGCKSIHTVPQKEIPGKLNVWTRRLTQRPQK
ncbi:hypothetical protein CR513_08124, partial [Mucuna pruriens]